MAGHSYEHDIALASAYGFLGSIDSNTGDASLGYTQTHFISEQSYAHTARYIYISLFFSSWDTDQFPMNLKDCSYVMHTVVKQGGIQPGGLNFVMML